MGTALDDFKGRERAPLPEPQACFPRWIHN